MTRYLLCLLFIVATVASEAYAGPTITHTGGSTGASAATNHTINISSPSVGDLVVAILTKFDTTSTVGWPSGWVALCNRDSNNGVHETIAQYKIIQTGDAEIGQATITVTTSNSVKSAHASFKAAAGTWHGTTPPECTTTTDVTPDTTPTSPALSPTWGSADNAWITATGWGPSTNSVSSCPTNYTGNCRDDHATGSNRMGLGSSYRTATAVSEDPGDFTVDVAPTGNENLTAAIRPAAATTAGPLVDSTPLKSLVGGGLVQ